jgi:hypothetical protein
MFLSFDKFELLDNTERVEGFEIFRNKKGLIAFKSTNNKFLSVNKKDNLFDFVYKKPDSSCFFETFKMEKYN